MKNIITFFVVSFAAMTVTASEIKALNMDIGHWVTTVDQSAMIEQMLAQIPEESRAMMQDMMKKKIQEASTSEQCITAETLENFDEQLKNSFSKELNCTFNVSTSTSEKFVGDLSCPGSTIHIETSVVNSKRNESKITTKINGMDDTTMTSVSEWKSKNCPQGL